MATEQKLYRDAEIDASQATGDVPECELSFSSEMPVARCDVDGKRFMEILSHDPANCDLSRLNNKHPLLLNHDNYDPENQIGVIKSARIDADRKGRALVRFSKSEKGQEIWQDVKDGIRGLVSVGYRIGKEIAREVRDGMEYRTFSWLPYEISLVSIPADTTVGVGRNAPELPPIETKTAVLPITIMAENPTPAPDITVIREQANKEQLARINEITAIAGRLEGRVENIRQLANDAISQGVSVDAFRTTALQALPTVQPVATAPKADLTPKDIARYSFSKAVSEQADGKLSGFERELNEELALKHGKRAEGFWLPDQVMARNAVAGTGTLGGMLVQTDNLASEFITLLRNKSQVLNLGARVINLTGPATIPRQNGAHTETGRRKLLHQLCPAST